MYWGLVVCTATPHVMYAREEEFVSSACICNTMAMVQHYNHRVCIYTCINGISKVIVDCSNRVFCITYVAMCWNHHVNTDIQFCC